MPAIRFEIIDSFSSFLDPRKAMEQHTEAFQVRLDPLTGKTGHLSHFGAIKPQELLLSEYKKPQI